jgi:NAD(P)-dependent dehydrogenase (short-subunit alcohol dehydrogenase family)
MARQIGRNRSLPLVESGHQHNRRQDTMASKDLSGTSLNLTGRTAIITGASRGIGLAISQRLAAAGANVVLTARKQEAAEAAAAQVGEAAVGVGAHAVDEDAARACVDLAVARFGSVDILINNAGTNPAFGPLIDQDHARFTKIFDVNLWAPLLWTSLVVKSGMGERGGAIVNTASIGGMHQSPGMGLYNATKAALIHVTKQLALELSPRIRVNAICPGVVRTRLAEALWKDNEDPLASSIALGRIGEPVDVAEAVAFLVSDGASWITGETLVIDGGLLLGPAQGFQSQPGGNR